MEDDDVPVLRRIRRLADPYGGCVTTSTLADAGIEEDHVASLVRRGALTRVVRAVYVVGAEEITHAQLLQAAVLLANRGAHLVDRSALEADGLLTPKLGSVCVARIAKRARAPRHLRTEINVVETGRRGRITLLTEHERKTRWETTNGLPAEPLERGLRRLAAAGRTSDLRHAWREADYRKLLLRPALEREIAAGEDGSSELAALLAEQPPREVDGNFRSRSEMRLWDAMVKRGIVGARVNHLTEIGDRVIEPDFFFVLEQLIVEADGPHHQLPTRAAEDRARDEHARAHGVETLRFSDVEIDRDADACAQTVEVTLAERGRRRAA